MHLPADLHLKGSTKYLSLLQKAWLQISLMWSLLIRDWKLPLIPLMHLAYQPCRGTPSFESMAWRLWNTSDLAPEAQTL